MRGGIRRRGRGVAEAGFLNPKTATSLSVAAALLLGGLAGGLRAAPAGDGDDVVRIVHQYPNWNGDPETVLEYHGMRFRHLISPSYAVTPDHKAVIFVTQKEGAISVLHYLPIGAGAPIDVGLGDSGFGAGLGYPEDDRSAQYVEGVNGNTILLAARYGGGAQLRHYALNLDKRTFVEVPAAGDSPP